MQNDQTIRHLEANTGVDPKDLVEIVRTATSFPDLIDAIVAKSRWKGAPPALKADLYERFGKGLSSIVNRLRPGLDQPLLPMGPPFR